MQQTANSDLKFIGGGVESGESLTDCLIREVKEESGYDVLPDTIREAGFLSERRKDIYQNRIWEMDTYMFTCEVDPLSKGEIHLTDGEKRAGLVCVFVTPEQAIKINQDAISRSVNPVRWAYRDLELLKVLFHKNTAE